MLGVDQSDELLYHIAVPLSTEPQSKSDDIYLLSEELLYEVAAQFSDEEQDKMDTKEPPATVLQAPLNADVLQELLGKISIRPLQKHLCLIHWKLSFQPYIIFTLLKDQNFVNISICHILTLVYYHLIMSIYKGT